MRRSPILTLACAMLAALAIMTSTAAAQTATGQITGTVRDATGAVMSGVKVVVTNQQTGLNRETKTGSNGDYVVPLLPAGVYLVTAEQTGFKTAILSDVALTVEQIQRLDFTLAPGAVSETVEVQASTLALDTSVGTPAAVLSVDAIQEFKEQTTTYSAEYGFSSNQINLVSRTGTNSFHGTGFGFFRNEAWDARNFFDDKTSPAPLLDQKQFGFVAGGPVMRDWTFFLVNYEGTRIDRGATNFYTVPTAEQLSGRFNTPIIDPATGAPFPNNTIPQSRFSRLAQARAQKPPHAAVVPWRSA